MNKYLIYPAGGDYLSALLKRVESGVTGISAEKFAQSDTVVTVDDLLYVSSDTVYPIIKKNLDSVLQTAFETFRDKLRFRQLIASLFESFFLLKKWMSIILKIWFVKKEKNTY